MRLGFAVCISIGILAAQSAAQAGSSGLHPKLKVVLSHISAHYGRPVQISSGCRSTSLNRRVGGRKASYHLRCMAADIRVPGVAERQLLAYVKRMPIVGGVGTYCNNSIVHVDVGPKRQWAGGCGKPRYAQRRVRKVLLAGR